MRNFAFALVTALGLAACESSAGDSAGLAALRKEIADLKARPAASPPAPGVELGQQMLELQIRHARQWQSGEAGNWMLTQFQLAELRETLSGVVKLNGEHAALQPKRLAEVLPAMMDPSIQQLQAAVDAQDVGRFREAFDAVSAACSACHVVSDHGFLVIQRPQTPILDNLRSAPAP